jgi:hypothetical protein
MATLIGGTWVKALGVPGGYSETIGIVSNVVDVDQFEVTSTGIHSISGVIAGAYYYLSQTTAGLITSVRPTSGTSLYVGIGESSGALALDFVEEIYQQPAGGGGGLVGVQQHASGSSVTVLGTTSLLRVDPNLVLPTLSIVLPSATYPQAQRLTLAFGGVIPFPDPVVTSLTILAPGGMTLQQALTPTDAISGDTYTYMRYAITWQRILD